MIRLRYLFLFLLLALVGCAKKPPSNLDNSCAIFHEKGGWYDAANDSFKKWGVPIQVQLAFIHQESRFQAQAKTPKEYVFWFIPWGRKSSAYGYAQVKDETWEWYIKQTGNSGADRDDFADAVDFIGWYGNYTYRTLGISKWDPYNQYLAYHEGHGGFKAKSYLKKPWLIEVARKVKSRAGQYGAQLKRCQSELEHSGFWPF